MSIEMEEQTDYLINSAHAAIAKFRSELTREGLMAIVNAQALTELAFDQLQPRDAGQLRADAARTVLDLLGATDSAINAFKTAHEQNLGATARRN